MKIVARFSLVALAVVMLTPLGMTGCGGEDEDGFLLFQRRRPKKTSTPAPTEEPTPPPPAPEPEPGSAATFASRTTGIAPLSVFFDAANTASPVYDSGVVQPATADFGSFHYAWNFGDPDSGTWTPDGRSRNLDTGFTAAHVYENPGVYTASLAVIDAQGVTHSYSQEITVSPFSGTTYYISANGNDSNNGTSTSTPWRTFSKMVQNAATNRRFLFERGGTYTASSAGEIYAAGPGIIGAYGVGARPVIQCTGSNGALVISTYNWRVMDLEFVGSGASSNSMGVTFIFHVQTREMLLYRCTVRDFWVNVGWYDYDSIHTTPHQDNMIVDCTVTSGRHYCAFVGGRRLAVVGNTMDTVTEAGHILRLWMCDKGVVTHNSLSNPIQHAFKLHGASEDTLQPKTRFVTISDNLITGGTWSTAIGPQDQYSDERVTQVLFERNWLEANSDTSVGMIVWARDVTIRNNVFVANGSVGWGYEGIVVDRRGIEPAATRVRISNNTLYKGDYSSEYRAFTVTSSVSNVTICNNLVSTPSITSAASILITGSCSGLVTQSNLKTNTPGFTDAAARNFTLTSVSPARNTGLTLVDVRNDYTLTTLRPLGGAYDLGALERD